MHFPHDSTLPEVVFWDWDGTIADSYSYLNDAHNYTLTRLGFAPFEDGAYRSYFGKPRDYLYPAIYKDKADQAIEIFQNYVFGNAHKVGIFDGCEDVIRYLNAKNIRMGIVSNKKAHFIREELRHQRFGECFSVIVGAGEAEADKPSCALLRLAVEKISSQAITPEAIWFIGDTENDLACARNYGAKAVFLKGHADTQKLIDAYNPYISFDNYSQLKEFLVAI